MDRQKIINNRMGKKIIAKYGIGFLDDALGGIDNEDFILIGSPTGAGKTELSTHIAFKNAEKIRVHLFALESDDYEPYYRELYKIMSSKYYKEVKEKINKKTIDMKYRNYVLNEINAGEYEAEAFDELERKNLKLNIWYKKDANNIEEFLHRIKEIENNCDLIILDHVDYLDLDESESENKAMTEIMKTLRKINQVYKKAIIVVSHLRKKMNLKQIIPDQEDFHGSSNKAKQVKTIILLAPHYDEDDYKHYRYSTYFRIAKSRIGAPRNIVGKVYYSGLTNEYEEEYTLSKVKMFGTEIEDIPKDQYPDWFKGTKNKEEQKEKEDVLC